jgi:AcrR family transcriptional regulator
VEISVGRRREVSDAEIIKAARRIFLEKGIQEPVNTVARELAVSPATLFIRMGTKQRLINAALWPPDPPVLKTLQDGFHPTAPFEVQLTQIIWELAVYAKEEMPPTFTLYAAGCRDKVGNNLAEVPPRHLRRALAKWFTQAIRCGEVSCDPRTLAELVIGTVEARAMHAFLARSEHSDRETRAFIRKMVATIMDGSRPESGKIGAESVRASSA